MPTARAIEKIKNFLLTLAIARGVPMLWPVTSSAEPSVATTTRGHSMVRSRRPQPDGLDTSQRRLACLVRDPEGPDPYLMFNADVDPRSFVLPAVAGSGRWRLVIDTAQPSSGDADPAQRGAGVVNGRYYAVGSRASVVLAATLP